MLIRPQRLFICVLTFGRQPARVLQRTSARRQPSLDQHDGVIVIKAQEYRSQELNREGLWPGWWQ